MARIQDPTVATLRSVARQANTPENLAALALEAQDAIDSYSPDFLAVRETMQDASPLERARAMLAAARESSGSRIALSSLAKKATVRLAEIERETPIHLAELVESGIEAKVSTLIRREEREIRLRTKALASGKTYEEYLLDRRNGMREKRLARMSPEKQAKKKAEDAKRAAILRFRAQAEMEARETQEKIANEIALLDAKAEALRVGARAL